MIITINRNTLYKLARIMGNDTDIITPFNRKHPDGLIAQWCYEVILYDIKIKLFQDYLIKSDDPLKNLYMKLDNIVIDYQKLKADTLECLHAND